MSTRSDYIPVPELFAAQFTPAGDGFVYRKSSVGEAKQVSLAERDRFVATFTYRRQYLIAALGCAVLLIFFFLIIQMPLPEGNAQAGYWASAAVPLGLYWIAHWAIWRAPARALKARAPVAAALTAKEARHLRLSRLSYGQLCGFAFMGVWVPSLIFREHAGWIVWDAFQWAMSVGCIVFAAVQALRKWRLERAG